MNVILNGVEMDINNDEALLAACGDLAAQDVKQIPTNYHTRALTTILQQVRYWGVKNGGMLVLASLSGKEGIGMQASLDAHNFMASVIGEPPLRLPHPPAANDEIEGEDVVLRDAQGRPIPPGQQELIEGGEL